MRTVALSLSEMITKIASETLPMSTLSGSDTLLFFDAMEGILERDSSCWDPTAAGSPLRGLGLTTLAIDELHSSVKELLQTAAADGRVAWRTSHAETTREQWIRFRSLMERGGLTLPPLTENEELDLMDRFSKGEARAFLEKHFPSEVTVA